MGENRIIYMNIRESLESSTSIEEYYSEKFYSRVNLLFNLRFVVLAIYILTAVIHSLLPITKITVIFDYLFKYSVYIVAFVDVIMSPFIIYWLYKANMKKLLILFIPFLLLCILIPLVYDKTNILRVIFFLVSLFCVIIKMSKQKKEKVSDILLSNKKGI